MVYQWLNFEIKKRVSHSIHEDRQLEANDEILFVFRFPSGIEVTHAIHKDKLLKIICAPMIISSDRVNISIPNQEADETGTIILCHYCKKKVHIDDDCKVSNDGYHKE